MLDIDINEEGIDLDMVKPDGVGFIKIDAEERDKNP